jgi:hypothetical protein
VEVDLGQATDQVFGAWSVSGKTPETTQEQEVEGLWTVRSNTRPPRHESNRRYWNPQRLQARVQRKLDKIESGLHGDMQRVAEMTTPLRSEVRTRMQQNRAKFLVG